MKRVAQQILKLCRRSTGGNLVWNFVLRGLAYQDGTHTRYGVRPPILHHDVQQGDHDLHGRVGSARIRWPL